MGDNYLSKCAHTDCEKYSICKRAEGIGCTPVTYRNIGCNETEGWTWFIEKKGEIIEGE